MLSNWRESGLNRGEQTPSARCKGDQFCEEVISKLTKMSNLVNTNKYKINHEEDGDCKPNKSGTGGGRVKPVIDDLKVQ